jgi:hypothetical protein
MKYLIISLALFLLLPLIVSASTGSGACSWHGGVNCNAGADWDGSVICYDGWKDSTVKHVDACISACDTYYTYLSSGINPLSSGAASLADACQQSQNYTTQPVYSFTNTTYDALVTCPKDATLNSKGECICMEGRIAYEGRCELSANVCNFTMGEFSQPIPGTSECECKKGYSLDQRTSKCINSDTWCKNTFGKYSVFIDDICKCDKGYDFMLVDNYLECKQNQASVDINNYQNDQSIAVKKEIENNVNLSNYDPKKFDAYLTNRLMGNILLQVENHGEAWYLSPKDGRRYYMKDGSVAYEMMRSFGLGITDADLNKIPHSQTTDEIKSASSICSSNSLANRMKGKILLQVQQHGEAYYVYPKNCRMIYMKDGAAAYQIMRYLGLGITNSDLEKVPSN